MHRSSSAAVDEESFVELTREAFAEEDRPLKRRREEEDHDGIGEMGPAMLRDIKKAARHLFS
jgi:hypothetical protein